MQPTRTDEVALLREYIDAGKLMQVATVNSDSKPWVVNVWYAQTPGLELIFTSNVARLHSGHIKENQAVAGSIIAIELKGLGLQDARGVTFSGTGRECSGGELEEAYETYAARWGKARELFPLSQIESGASPMRMYKITPTQFILFDEENFPKEPKRVILRW